jgi:hypothetical protein
VIESRAARGNLAAVISLSLMKTNIVLVLAALSFSAGHAAPAPVESVRVQASRNLRVMVVDASKPSEARTAVHEAFASTLAASLFTQSGISLPVKLSEETDANKVAADLAEGVYDAAIIFENNLPSSLRTPEFSTTRGVSEMGVPVRVFHFVLRSEDPSMVMTVNSAFAQTVKNTRFQQSLARTAEIRVVASTEL